MNLKEISKNPLFKGIEYDELEKLLVCLKAHTKVFTKHEFILRRGTHVTQIALLVRGSALIIKDDYWGNRTIIKEVLRGELFGEAYACVPNVELEVSVLAKDDCEILFLDTLHMLQVCCNACHYHQRLIQNLLTIASMKNIMLTQKIEHITKRSIREKILSYLSSQSLERGSRRIDIPFDRQQLADYLSVDRSALSAELSKMRKEGILEYQKNHFRLL